MIVAATALAASGVATGAATSISARSADHTERSAVLKSVALASWELEEALRLAAIRRSDSFLWGHPRRVGRRPVGDARGAGDRRGTSPC